MSSFTPVAPPAEYKSQRKPPRKGARQDRRTKSSGDEYPQTTRSSEKQPITSMGLEGLRAVRWQLLKLFGRIERFGEQIDEAFAGQPLLPNLSPLHPTNRRRFEAFLHEQKQITNLFGRALELWMLTCHLERGDNWIPPKHRKHKTKERRRRRAPQN
jgi:hypothetical protein